MPGNKHGSGKKLMTPSMIRDGNLYHSLEEPEIENGAVSLNINASDIYHADNGLSEGSNPKSKYSELLQRKN